MNLKETKKGFNTEIKKELGKSRLEVLTNENDFLVRNLKMAGWSDLLELKYFFTIAFLTSFLRQNNIFLNYHPKYYFPNIKFLLNIQTNTLYTKHIKQILVIFFRSQ